MPRPKLVIIGGGYAGLTLAQSSSSFLDVTVVDRKDFFEHVVANVRAVVDAALIDKVQMPYKDIKKLGTFVQGTVIGLDDKVVSLEDGRTLPYDYVVIATGTSYQDPLGKPFLHSGTERKNELLGLYEKVKSASNILIVGGGPTGVELVAEILENYPQKAVTLVTSASQLLHGKSEKMGRRALEYLQKAGAKLILNEKVQKGEGSPDEYVTTLGTKLTADCVFWTISSGPNTEWLKNSLPHVLNDKGQVKVDEYLRVVGSPNVFAVGDVTSTPEWKQAYYAGESAKLLAKNLQALVKAKSVGKPAQLAAWTPNGGMEAQFVSLGRNAGVGHLGSLNAPSWFVKMMKSKHLFVPKIRKEFLGEEEPSSMTYTSWAVAAALVSVPVALYFMYTPAR